MKVLQVAIAFYVLSFLVFAVSAAFGIEGWDIGYYLCADMGMCLIWGSMYSLSAETRRLTKPVLIFSIIVLLWDIISYSAKIGVNHPAATGVGFGVAIMVLLYYLLKDQKWK